MADQQAGGELPTGASAQAVDMAQLVGDFHQSLYAYAYRLTGSTADAEDLTQQTYLAAQQKLGQLRQVESARSWLYTILRNCYLKSFRRQLPMSAASVEDYRVEEHADESFESEPGEEIDREALQAALNALPDDFKLVLLLFYFEERSYQQIAAELDIPLGTVMSRLSRAKAQLRKALSSAQAAQPTSDLAQNPFQPSRPFTETKKPTSDRPVVLRR
jgi:RNA polymerase sigma-70 factor (ECF subfamily)